MHTVTKEEVRFALTKQPGKDYPAIDGDGHGLLTPEYFEGQIPETWDISHLERTHQSGGGKHDIFTDNGRVRVDEMKAIYTLELHYWVASQIETAFPGELNKRWEGMMGRGSIARNIMNAIQEWVDADG